jgi:RHS repeat-associated protein
MKNAWEIGVLSGIFSLGLSFASAGVAYYHPDHLGSTSVVSDQDTRIVELLSYTPFGESLIPPNPPLIKGGVGGFSPYQYTGQELDRDSDLYYYGARYYDPALARFISIDAAFDSPSPYSYVQNNPIRYTDPTGNFSEEAECEEMCRQITALGEEIGVLERSQSRIESGLQWGGAGLSLVPGLQGLGGAISGTGVALKAHRTGEVSSSDAMMAGAGFVGAIRLVRGVVTLSESVGSAIVVEETAAGGVTRLLYRTFAGARARMVVHDISEGAFQSPTGVTRLVQTDGRFRSVANPGGWSALGRFDPTNPSLWYRLTSRITGWIGDNRIPKFIAPDKRVVETVLDYRALQSAVRAQAGRSTGHYVVSYEQPEMASLIGSALGRKWLLRPDLSPGKIGVTSNAPRRFVDVYERVGP